MSRTVALEVFQYSELSKTAKGRAREQYKDQLDFDPEFEDIENAAELLGITFDKIHHKNDKGYSWTESNIQWSGFYHQGSGASFGATYECRASAVEDLKEAYPEWEKLHRIAGRLAAIQAGCILLSPSTESLSAKITVDTMTCDLLVPEIADDEQRDTIRRSLREAMEDFADEIWKELLDQYESLHSDESVEAALEDQGDEYTIDGDIYD
jgi:hypothetical protein